MKLKTQLKLFRVKNGDLTQQDLADKVGCSRQTINSIEKEKFKPSVELAIRLSKALECRVEDLFEVVEE